MSRNDLETAEAIGLDRRWDELNAGDPVIRRPDRADGDLRDLVSLDVTDGPRPEFVSGLQAKLREEARRIGNAESSPQTALDHVVHRAPVARRFRRMQPVSTLAKATSVLLAASLLVAIIAGLSRYPWRDGGGPDAATIVAQSEPLPDVPMPGADPARTNVQPGPALTMLPEIKQTANVVGQSMALADNKLIIVHGLKVRALDARSLTELWSVTMSSGNCSAPTIAGGAIYLGCTRHTESYTAASDNNQLVALSMTDGREIWRRDGAGVTPVAPIVVGDTVYSVGATAQAYELGAFKRSDGSPIWQAPIGGNPWCCPGIGLAQSGEVIAVSLLGQVGVYRMADGSAVWTESANSGEFFSTPSIIDGLLVVNSASEPEIDSGSGQFEGPISGSTLAFNLASGTKKWTNEASRSHRLPASMAPNRDAVLYSGPWLGSDGGQIALFSTADGRSLWSVPQPQVPGSSIPYGPADVAPVVVGETAYVVSFIQPVTGGSVQASLLSAVDLRTGEIRWMAQIDGGIATSPIVSGGRIYMLTHDAGLYVLGDSDKPVGAPGTVVDLRTPVTCTASPSDSPMLGELPDQPTIPGVAEWKQAIRFSQIPSGTAGAVAPAVADQLAKLFAEYRACSQVDPYHGVFGFFSTDFYVRLNALPESLYYSKEQPWAVWMAPMQEFLTLDANSLQRLPDGRIGGIVNSPYMNIYVWFVQEDGAWKIDEYHRIEADPVDPNATAPSPGAKGDLGEVWPSGAGGSGDFTIPEGPDPLRIRLARVQLPSGASLTIPPGAEAGIVIAQGSASMSDPAQDGTWQSLPVGSSASLASSASTTVANYGEEPVVLNVLAIGKGQAFTSAENGAEIVTLVDVEIDSLPAGPAYYSYEGRMAVSEMAVIEDTSRDGVALLVVDSGTFAVARDGGTWQMGSVSLEGASDPIPAEAFPASGQIELSAGSFALITSGAAFHGTAANGGEARYFLLTIEVNSAAVQQAETRVAESTAPPAGEPENSDGTPPPETD